MSAANKQSRIISLGWGWFVLCGIIALAALRIWLVTRNQRSEGRSGNENSAGLDPQTEEVYSAYAGSASCKECHEEEFRLWAVSHHGLAQRSVDETVDQAAFSPGRILSTANQTMLVRQASTNLEIVVTGLYRTQQVFRVDSVLGVSPLRQFLVSFPGGRLQTLELSYDPRSNEWFNVFGSENRHAGEWGHWTGRGMNWNSMCAGCHNTGVRKNYDERTDAYHTTMVEQGVGCEACHGPLRAHNEWQKRLGKSGKKDPTIPKWPTGRVVDNCGFCHARRGDLTGDFKPGEDFLDHLQLEIPSATELFYADGQVHEEDYEYGAFLGSRMHARGVSCTDCHNPHSARTLLPGNWLCMRCHNGTYTNAPVIEPVSHSHHKVFGYAANGVQTNADLLAYQPGKPAETGGECVNCHMPQTAYMQRHWRHDHGFTTPDPLLTKEAGVPNACNRCHRDQDADWALNCCERWYGAKMERPSRQRAQLVTAARRRQPGAARGLVKMLATNDLAYWRAVAAGLLQPWAGEPEVRAALLRGLLDTNSLVRTECVQALQPLAGEPASADALKLSLTDPVRAVRVGAAWALRANLDLASPAAKELLHCLAANADQPAGQMQLGAFFSVRGEATNAVEHYQRALEWDPNSAVIRHDYAVVLSTLNRPQEAVEQLQTACKLEPKNAEFQYKLALAWNELGRKAEVIECLRQAVRLDPSHARAWYNLGLALSAEGRTEEALDALNRAESVDASDPRNPFAQATILAQLGRVDEARRAARRALQIEPGFEAARELMQKLSTANGRE